MFHIRAVVLNGAVMVLGMMSTHSVSMGADIWNSGRPNFVRAVPEDTSFLSKKRCDRLYIRPKHTSNNIHSKRNAYSGLF